MNQQIIANIETMQYRGEYKRNRIFDNISGKSLNMRSSKISRSSDKSKYSFDPTYEQIRPKGMDRSQQKSMNRIEVKSPLNLQSLHYTGNQTPFSSQVMNYGRNYSKNDKIRAVDTKNV
eukprot:GHVR01020160.1.p1 GENE.GHVR01020160.1~~GHVR01020160.1.p1  ORF type:complete len:119 (+),score=7.57 GHVR01020160.1:764-1120(+)